MKPKAQFDDQQFPRMDCFFQARDGRWRGYGGDESWNFRRYNLGREYLIESARERAKEMIVFAIILAAAAWERSSFGFFLASRTITSSLICSCVFDQRSS